MKNLEKKDSYNLKCYASDDNFRRFSDLEVHIKDKQEEYQRQNCDQCEKKFVTAWRLRKHE